MENILIIILGLSMIYISSTSRLTSHINILILQGLLLFFISCLGYIENIDLTQKTIISIAFIILETLIIKAIVIPIILKKVMRKTKIQRDTKASVAHFYSLVISSMILFCGFMIAHIEISEFKLISPLYFGVSIAIIIISLWLITIKHTILSNVINFITIENGIFLLSLSVAKEMPVIINLGVLLDIFIAVFILGMLIREINIEFKDMEVSHISELKDYDE